MDYAALLKPPPFTVAKVADPEQLLQDFLEYLKIFKKFVLATGVGGELQGYAGAGGGQRDVRAVRAHRGSGAGGHIHQGYGENRRRDQEADQPGYCEVQIVH